MKKLLPVLILFSLFQFSSYSQSPVVQEIINKTNIDSLMYFVKELSGEVQTIIGGAPYTIQSRNKNQPSNDKAADYIKQKLEGYGIAAYDQWWSGTGRNVYGVQTGTTYPNQKYIICAHYDDMPSGLTAPGADDNGSGTAAVLEAARIFSQYNSDYTIVYALFDEEEQGLVGSSYFAQQAYNNGDSILGVINMDMIAWDSNNDYIAEIHTKPIGNSVQLANHMVAVNTDYNIGAVLQIMNPGSTASDHSSFWNYGYSANMLIERYFGGDFNLYYHTVNDLIQYFNATYFLKLSQVSYGTLAELAGTDEIIPVELISFYAIPSSECIELRWATATELNNLGFEIERAVDRNVFSTIGFIMGNGTTSETSNYLFSDSPDLNGKHLLTYRLKQTDYNGTFSYSKAITVEYGTPEKFVLNQNYPNPFNPATRITYAVAKDVYVTLKVYDFLGREIKTLVDEVKAAGSYDLIFDVGNLPSGTYFYSLRAGDFVSTKKMMLVK